MSKKRAHGEGTIRQLPSGRWSWARMAGRDEHGKIIYDRITADTQRELIQAIEQYKHHQPLAITNCMTFSTFADRWYNLYKESLRVSTQNSYLYTLEKLKTYWGNKSLNDIVASDVTDMLIHFRKIDYLSESYIKKLRSMMYQIMDAAEADNLIPKNPVRLSKYRVPSEENTTEKDAFTPEEIKQFLSAPQGKTKDFAILALATGMRSQEFLALQGNDIAADGSSIKIQKAVNMAGNIPVIGKTKSHNSIRTIPVPDTVQHIAAKYAAYGNQLIWQSPVKVNRPINPSTFRAAFERLCKTAGVRTLTPHCCRHTYVTQLYERNVHETTIKMLVGHARRDVTASYTHISKETLSAAANKLNNLFDSINLSE